MKKPSLDTLYLNVGPPSIDACLLQKGDGVRYYAENRELDLRRIGYIGDSTSDISVMSLGEVGFIGAPANVEFEVVEYMKGSGKRHFISDKKYLDGFLDFYEEAKKMGLDAVMSDRDGVLYYGVDFSRGNDFAKRLRVAGQKDNPAIIMLTGSTFCQNTDFLRTYGFSPENLSGNDYVQKNPYIALLENSALWINALKPQEPIVAPIFDKGVLEKFTGEFKKNVMKEMENSVLPKFGFGWSDDQSDKNSKVYVPPKLTMITFDVPKTSSTDQYFRKSQDAELFRREVLEIMMKEAEKLHLPVTVT